MSIAIQRHDWVNAFLGMLDASVHLTEEEQGPTFSVLRGLCDTLDIPGRGVPQHVPVAVALEAEAHLFTDAMAGPRQSGVVRPVGYARDHHIVLPLETWVQAFMNMLESAYPDLGPMERMSARKVFAELLIALGLPERAVHYYPYEVIQVYLETL